MEHIVQFAINIDDKTIQKRLEDNAYDDVVKRIYKEALDNLEFPRTYGNRIRSCLPVTRRTQDGDR